MLKLRKTRRAIAMSAATLALAGGAALGTAGAAHASGSCANVGAYGASASACVDGGGSMSLDIYSYGASTDVRVYAWEEDGCGNWHSMGSFLVQPNNDYHYGYFGTGCGGPYKAIAKMTESGKQVSYDESDWR